MITCLYFALIFNIVHSVYGENDVSLTFVIDDTNSMGSEIKQVGDRSIEVYEAVKNSNKSNIKNFILVTFGDINAKVRTITEDGEILRRELSTVHLTAGGDCPESVYNGIYKAAVESLPGSNIYVFTDAAPKDFGKLKDVKILCQKKQIQIVFLLTGKCPNEKRNLKYNKHYTEYRDLAIATSGQVFNIHKNDVNEIINYIKFRAKDRKSVITCRKFGPGNHIVHFTVDDKMTDVVVSVTGTDMVLSGADGKEVITSDLVRLSGATVVKITDAKPGVYTIQLTGEAMVTVTGTTDLFFTYGFLGLEVDTINNTATRPIADEKTHLYIKLSTEDPVLLKIARLLDVDENIIMEESVRIVDKKENLYVTDLFVSPNKLFKVGIEVYDEKNKVILKRISPTPVEPQTLPTIEKIESRLPVVTLGKSQINVEYESSVKLQCLVKGFPKPTITWIDVLTKAVVPSDVTAVELPYEYLSVLNINKVDKNVTYECKASNSLGENRASINVITKNNIFFELTCPESSYNVPMYGKVELVCKTNANPPAEIIWYINTKLVKGDTNVYISPDGTKLTIRRMKIKYRKHPIECRAKHVVKTKSCVTRLEINDKKPKLSKPYSSMIAMKGTSVSIPCRIEEGDKPITKEISITAIDSSEKTFKLYGDMYVIKNVNDDDEGYYECIAENYVGKDKYKVHLHVEYPPTVNVNIPEHTIIERGRPLVLDCQIHGKPKPNVTWTKNSAIKLKRDFYTGSYQFWDKDTWADADYTCEAINKHNVDRKTISVSVYVPVTIKVPRKSSITVIVGNNVELDCKADGYPKPEISWRAYIGGRVFNVSSSPTGSKKLQNMQFQQEGLYVCTASNKYNSINITYDVKVIVPAKILRRRTNFDGIVGDPLLMIPCVAEGRPKPKITWFKDGYSLASSTTKYNIEADGTLQIFNIDDGSTGLYECEAKNNNNMYEDKMTFKVMVHPYTFHQHNTSRIVLVEEGKPLHLECEASKTSTDIIRWYKYGQPISTRTVEFEEASTSDTGRYTCRVFKDGKHHMGDHAVFVKVGSKPLFKTNVKLDLDLAPKTETYLNCEAVGTPAPMVNWRHNDGKTILALTPYYITKEPGEYHCSVSNEFGAINRTFKISLRECLLDIRSDFNTRAPLILESSLLTQPDFEICNDYMRIPSGRTVSLHCPISAGFEHFNTSMIHATCYRKTEFKIQEKIFNFSQLKCKKNWKSTTRESPQKTCMKTGNYLVEMGYSTRGGFLAVYKICYNKKERLPFYALKDMKQMTCSDTKIPRNNVSPVSSPREEWYSESLMPYLFDDMYSCTMQNSSNTMDFKKWFGVSRGSCSIGKRQLLHPRHLTGLPQGIAYSYLNVVPQLKQYMDNWDDVERRVELRRKEVSKLRVLSGGLYHIPGESRTRNSYILDRYNNSMPVPIYLWKIVDVIVIVQINVPKLTKSELRRYIFCDDLCDKNPWTRNTAWRNINNGYIFCCDQNEFLDATGLR